MEERTLAALEFGKMLHALAGLAVSEGGREACLALRPEKTLSAVEDQRLLFEEAAIFFARTQTPLAPFPPLERIFRALDSPSAELEADALWGVRQTMGLARDVRRAVVPSQGGRGESASGRPLLEALARRGEGAENVTAALFRCLSDEGLIRDESTPELLSIRQELRALHQTCLRRVREFAQRYNIAHYLQDEFMTLAADRYVLPLKANFKGRLQGIVHDYSQTGETCYFEPMFLVELNNTLQALKRRERDEERAVLRYLTGLLRQERAGAEGAYAFLVEMDVLQAKAALGRLYGGRVLLFSEGGGIVLKDARHPLLALEAARASSPSSAVVPVDILLRPQERALVISGGNAGGKTVALKTLGLAVLLGMAGVPVPAEAGSTLPVFHKVHAFIGDDQSLEDHLSTFTAQIDQLARIWSGLDRQTLVLLDEFGAGTDPSQGAALAQAVMDGFLEKEAFVFAATHFPALKAYALSQPGVRTASVLFDPADNRPLYRLAYDQVGASRALDVARAHGLDEKVLKRAESYLLMDAAGGNALIERLNALAVEREQELERLRAEEARFLERRRALGERFEAEKKKLEEELRRNGQAIMQRHKEGRLAHRSALKELARTREQLRETTLEEGRDVAQPSRGVSVGELEAGLEIFYRPWGRGARVEEVSARNGKVRIGLNGLSMWVSAEDLDAAPPAGSSKSARNADRARGADARDRKDAGEASAGAGSTRLDLRGMRGEEAIAALEGALDHALLRGFRLLEVVHGRGTGVLRRQVHEFLRTAPGVASYQLASEEFGGDGMTEVFLK